MSKILSKKEEFVILERGIRIRVKLKDVITNVYGIIIDCLYEQLHITDELSSDTVIRYDQIEEIEILD